ncbi:YncE family protein [Halobacillus salinarum]|uniref:YncE family protein n=1 Tax=Halobacillus salinarum TaxID=2932257 RepID=A0ABY4EJJ9_9BACI|nr:YncE family protein [Halobacillus salinarum]UOQ44248.1 YncE family protein [Halobacillus salinarum]
MTRISLLSFVCLLFLLSGCKNETLNLPEQAEDAVLVSHLKDSGLSFINKDTERVLGSVKLDSAIAAMVRIHKSEIAFTSKNEHVLYLLNTKSGKLKKWGDVGSGVNELIYSPENHQVYLADSDNNQIQVFDTEREKVTVKIPVGKFPLSMTIDHKKNLLYVLNQQSSSIHVINLNTYKVIDEFPTPHLPEGLLLKGSKLFVGGHGPVHGKLNKYVYIFDPSTGEEVGEVKVGLMPVSFYSPSDSSEVYVVCHGSSELYKFSVADPSETHKLKVGTNPFEVTGSDKRIYVSSMDSNSLSIINKDSFQITSKINISGGPFSIIEGGIADEHSGR